MRELRRIISMVMVFIFCISAIPMNGNLLKAEETPNEGVDTFKITARIFDGEKWKDAKFDYKFNENRIRYEMNIDKKYTKIQFFVNASKTITKIIFRISAAGTEDIYKIEDYHSEALTIPAGTSHFKFLVEPYSSEHSNDTYNFKINRTSSDGSVIRNVYLKGTLKRAIPAYAGDLIKIKTGSRFYGKIFDKWIVDSGNFELRYPGMNIIEFIMPDKDFNISDNYKDGVFNDSSLRNIYVYALKDEIWEIFYVPIDPNSENNVYELNLQKEYDKVYLIMQEDNFELDDYSEDKLNKHFNVKLNNNPVAMVKDSYYNRTEKLNLSEGGNVLDIKVISNDESSKSNYTLKINRGEVKYKVRFDSGEGKGSMEAEEFVKGSTYKLPECIFEAPENKEFKAWEVNGKEKAVGEEITINDNIEVRALWKDIMVSVSFDPGEGKGLMDPIDFVKGSTYELPECTFEAPANKEFKSWSVNGEEKAVGEEITINDNIEVRALWKDIMVSVRLVPGEGTGEAIVKEFVKGSTHELPDCPFTAPDGQVFKAWQIADKEYNPQDTIIIDGETLITAIWQAKPIEKYKVTLVANNGTNDTKVVEKEKGTEYTLPDCPFAAPDEQVFKAWQIDNKEYKPQESIKIDEATIIKAIWQDKTDPDKPNPGEDNSDEDNPGEESPDKPNQKHAINITPSPYGEVIIDPREAKAGDKVTVRAIAKYGYELVSLSVCDASGELLPITNDQFIMPDGEVDIYPIFREIAPYTEPEIYDKAEREEQKRKSRRNYYYNEEEKDEDEAKTIDKAKEEKQKESKVLITIGSEMLDKVDNGVRTLKAMDTKPYIKGGRTMLPLRYLAEALGYRVAWLSETRTAVIMDIGLRVEIPVDSSFIIVNGVKYTSDVKPEIVNNRIMLPIANIARALGLKDGKDILWDEVNRQVTLIRNFNTK